MRKWKVGATIGGILGLTSIIILSGGVWLNPLIRHTFGLPSVLAFFITDIWKSHIVLFSLALVIGIVFGAGFGYLVDRCKRTKNKNWIPRFAVLASVCLVGIGLAGYHYFFKPQLVHEGPYSDNSTNAVSYRVGDCERGIRGKGIGLVSYDEQNKILNAEVWVNCCGVEVKVEKEDSTYKILEKQYGELCRCMCKRRVTIFNVPKEAKVEFLDKDGNYFILSPNIKFCGWSTYGKCDIDADCITDGCSSQVCRSKFEEQVITSCEWLDCYNANKYGVACKCVDEKCQWVKNECEN